MKKLLVVGVVCAAPIANSVMAADLAAPVAVVAPISNWTGAYIGGDLGWFGAHQSGTTATGVPAPGFGDPPIGILPTSHGLDSSGFLGGLHAGYNWQLVNLLLGIEGDVMWLRRDASDTETVIDTFAGPNPAFTMLFNAHNNWLASARARIGWVADQWMLYATGGAAWTTTSYTTTATGLTIPPNRLAGISTTAAFSDFATTGYVVGAGVEWMLTQNWLIRAEYLHYGFGTSSGQLPLLGSAPDLSCLFGQCIWAIGTSRLNFDTVRVGVSYKFGELRLRRAGHLQIMIG